jgi:hypothetical protein
MPPSDDTVAGCINIGMAKLDLEDPEKQSGEIWILTSQFSVW